MAQSPEPVTDPLQEIVVTASRIPVPLQRVGSSISIIEASELEAHGNLALTDILRQLPAIQVSTAGGPGKATSLRIRGEEGYRTLTIIDGLRLSDPAATQIGPQTEHLLSSGIERIEVLRGPQGLGYGADAGGVLNISSPSETDGVLARLDASSGSFDTSAVNGSLGAGNRLADFFVTASQLRTDGFNSLASDNIARDRDGYSNDTLHFRGGVNLGQHWRGELVQRKVDSESLYDNCFSTALNGHDCVGLYELDARRLALHYNSADFSHTLSYNRSETDRDSLSDGFSAFRSNGELERWEYLGSAGNLPGFDLVFGADREEALNGGIGRSNTGIHLEYLSDFSDSLFMTAGVRHDDNEDFGSNTSYRLSTAYLVPLPDSATLKLKASAGSGFRAPSPYEIAYNRGPFAAPPASTGSLSQERSRGWEAGFRYLHAGLSLEVVYFDQKIADAIYFDPAGFSGYLQDRGQSSSKGTELSGKWAIADAWRLSANYTYNDTERPNGQQRLRRPRQLLNAGLSWYGMKKRLNLNAFLRMSDDSIDESGGAIVQMDGFQVLDLSASYSLGENIRLYGRLENALDEDYQEINGYNTAGKAAYFGIRLSYAGL